MFKKINEDRVIKSLTTFALERNKKLFVVGGAIRDELMGKIRSGNKTDFDLCGTLSLSEVVEFAKNNGITHEIKNKKLQVVALRFQENIYEYARLRTEEYSDASSHTPTKVEFVDDVMEDAKRRDFTINSVYYATHSTEIIDPFGGVQDIMARTLRSTLDPSVTLSVDPARVLRLVEAASRFDLTIEQRTISAAKAAAKNIKKLSAARLNKELARILEIPKYDEKKEEYLARVRLVMKKLDILYLLERT